MKRRTTKPIRLSEHYKLNKSQHQLDFVDVYVEHDIRLFVDPSLFALYDDAWSNACHNDICGYFQSLVDKIIGGHRAEALRLLQNLSEPKETHLGFGVSAKTGRGIGAYQALTLYDKLSQSTAVKTGFVTDLSDCELMVKGIGFDKISDLVTNIIRKHLIAYTQNQCDLLDIATFDSPSGFAWDNSSAKWARSTFVKLPRVNNHSVIFIPKKVVVYQSEFDAQHFYNNDILEYLQAAHLHADDALVETLKNGSKRVTKESLRKEYGYSKEFIYDFCNNHPEVLDRFKQRKQRTAKQKRWSDADLLAEIREQDIADVLIERLSKVELGGKSANEFHDFCIGALEFIFYPLLNSPSKEREINSGRKRIDITFLNDAPSGFFYEMRTQPQYRSAMVMIECKNYMHEVSNPELDQLSGRFSNTRGQFGLLIARQFDDRAKFIERCRDTLKDGRGLVIPLVDEDLIKLLQYKGDNQQLAVEQHLKNIYQEIIA
jgi:hypothetical protein